MRYATWNLTKIDDNYLDGPENKIAEQGGSAEAIWANGSVQSGATILGKVQGDTTNLDRWNFVELTRAEAEAFIAANFTIFTDRDGIENTLLDALKVLD